MKHCQDQPIPAQKNYQNDQHTPDIRKVLILQVSTQVCSLFSWNHKFKFLILLHVILPYVFLHPSWQDYIASSHFSDSREEMYGAPQDILTYEPGNMWTRMAKLLNSSLCSAFFSASHSHWIKTNRASGILWPPPAEREVWRNRPAMAIGVLTTTQYSTTSLNTKERFQRSIKQDYTKLNHGNLLR